MERVKSLQKHDFQHIHETFRPRITRYLSGLAGEDKAEDLCQEVFVKVAKGLKDFRGEANLSTWIYRIATNAYHDHVRSRSFKQQAHEQLTPVDEIDVLKGESSTPDEQSPVAEQKLIRGEMIDCIRGYIDQLPDDFRLVLLLSEEEGFKNREIAEILQLSLGNVKIRLHRARARLKELLEGHCDFYLDDRSELACDRKQDRDCR